MRAIRITICLGMTILYWQWPCQALEVHDHKQQFTPTVNYKNKSQAYWQKHLQAEVYHICREKGTERPGSGKYDNFYEDGKYYCACCGGDYLLFDSATKYDSHTGWPSFWQPADPRNVELVEQTGWFGHIIEVRCGRCGSHLGDLFDDGPEPTGKRYCINSLALVFVAKDQNPVRTYPAL